MKEKEKKPEKFNPNKHDAGTIHEWLASRGIPVLGVSVTDENDILVETEGDVDVDLTAFEPPVDRTVSLIDQLNAINLDKPNINELASALKLIRDILTSP